jgi:hypothetical protein
VSAISASSLLNTGGFCEELELELEFEFDAQNAAIAGEIRSEV